MSAINTGSINVNYPVPGVNNSSQGFRDNFSSIKNNIDVAATEITELQNKSIVKAALNGITLDNDMNNTLISNAQTLRFRGSTFALGNNLTGVIPIDLSKGDYQYGTVVGNSALEFSKWAPSGTWSRVTVALTISAATVQISLPAAVTIGTKTLENFQGGNFTVLGSQGLDTPSVVILEFSTADCGTTISVNALNRPRRATQLVTTVPTSSKGAAGDRAGSIAADSTYLYVCVGTYNGSTDIWKRVALTGGTW